MRYRREAEIWDSAVGMYMLEHGQSAILIGDG